MVVVIALACLPARAGLRDDAEHLSDPLLEGRGHGTRGTVEASLYIIRRMQQIGLEPRIQFFRTERGVGRNVYAVCTGNPRSVNYTLVCAHYDGVGTIDGNVYPGADTNASGVAVMLYLAGQLKNSGRNFIFVALDAYSERLAGAEKFATMPYKLSMVVNIDTIGSSLAPPNKYRPDFLIVLGGNDFEKQNSKQFDKANEGPRLRLYYDYYRSKSFTEYFYTRISDQAPFLRNGIPAVMFTSGITMNTNKVIDTAETLDWGILERRAELIRNWLLI